MSSTRVAGVAADSNVLLSAIIGKAARRVFAGAPGLRVVTTEANLAEVIEHLPVMADRYGLDLTALLEVASLLPLIVYGEPEYRSRIVEARKALEKRDPDDVPLAALAMELGLPIWSNDNDFEDVPVEVYTTARLLQLLGV